MIENLINKKFGRLMPTKYCGKYKWECLCGCGKITIARTSDLNNGKKKSCGCLRKEITIKNNKLKRKYTDKERLEKQREANRESYKKYREKRLIQTKVYVNNNKAKVYERQRNWRIKTEYTKSDKWRDRSKKNNRIYRDRLMQFKIGKFCVTCGENRPCCLDFHHKDPKTKIFNISEGRWRKSEILEKEIKKCILLCANCHRALHFTEIEKLDYINFKETK